MRLRLFLFLQLLFAWPALLMAQRYMEDLGRGVVAVRQDSNKVFISWRLLATDAPGVAFDVYRTTVKGKAVKLNKQPLNGATHFTDASADLSKTNTWNVKVAGSGQTTA